MTSERTEGFSDGVMAVAITLLALNLTVAGPGHGALSHQLVERWPSVAAYVVSFFTIGVIWVNHHNLFRNIEAVDRLMMYTNLVLLFFVVLIPVVTNIVAEFLREKDADAHLAAALYSAILLGTGLSFSVVNYIALVRQRTRVPLAPEQVRRAVVRFSSGTLVYALAIGLAFVDAPISVLLDALVAVFYIAEQTPIGRTQGATSRPAD